MLQVQSIIRRSDQGVTAPFLCVLDNGVKAWVKGASLRPSDFAAEWICGNLAKSWGLPIAHFELVEIPKILIENSVIKDIKSLLGSGIGFASFHVENAEELNYSDLSRISYDLMAEIFLFDFWIQNDDRTLDASGGNPNMLWANENLTIIDHNNAFDMAFNCSDFIKKHAFLEYRHKLADKDFQNVQQNKMLEILNHLPHILDAMPEEWFSQDDDLPIPLKDEVDRIIEILNEPKNNPKKFWENFQ